MNRPAGHGRAAAEDAVRRFREYMAALFPRFNEVYNGRRLPAQELSLVAKGKMPCGFSDEELSSITDLVSRLSIRCAAIFFTTGRQASRQKSL